MLCPGQSGPYRTIVSIVSVMLGNLWSRQNSWDIYFRSQRLGVGILWLWQSQPTVRCRNCAMTEHKERRCGLEFVDNKRDFRLRSFALASELPVAFDYFIANDGLESPSYK